MSISEAELIAIGLVGTGLGGRWIIREIQQDTSLTDKEKAPRIAVIKWGGSVLLVVFSAAAIAQILAS